MKRDAEEHAAEDHKRRELVDLKNQAEQSVIECDRQLKEHADKIPADVKQTIQEKRDALEKVKKSDDAAAIKPAIEALQQALYKVSEQLYRQAGASGAAGGGPRGGGATGGGEAGQGGQGGQGGQAGGPKGGGDNIVDAEFEVKDS